jgi:integrase
MFAENGHPLSGDSLRRGLTLINRAIDLSPAQGRTGLWVHALRHYFAQYAIERGVPIATLATHLGHTTFLMAARYARPSEQFIP